MAEDGNHFQIIAQRRGILERMRAVGVEETAAVGAEHLDRFLGCDRPLRDHLVGDRVHYGLAVGVDNWFSISDPLHLLRLDQFHRVIGSEVLHHALRNQYQRINDARRQQHPECGPREIDPEIADGVFLPP